MSKKKSKKKKSKQKEVSFPSAVMLKEDCYNEYARLIASYDKIYDRVNILLAFCGAIVIGFLQGIDFKVIRTLATNMPSNEYTLRLCYSVLVGISFLLLFYSIIGTLGLLKGRNMFVFDSMAIREEYMYKKSEDIAALRLIEIYTDSISSIKPVYMQKQQEFNELVIKSVGGLVLYTIAFLLKGACGWV